MDRNEARKKIWEELRKVAKPDSRFHWDFAEFIADYEGSEKGAELIRDLEVYKKAKVIDAKGKYVFPGFIDAHSHIGIFEEAVGEIGEEGNEWTDPVTPQLRAIDAINPADQAFEDAVMGGITCVFTGPGSANVIGGQSVIMKTHGKIIDSMVVKAPAGLKVAFGENPKRVYGEQKKMPATRMATAALLREALTNAQNYKAKREKNHDKPDDRSYKT